MIKQVHEHIISELQQNARTDTVFVLTAILLNLLTLAINSSIAQESRKDSSVFITMFIFVSLTIVVNLVVISGLFKGKQTRFKLLNGLMKMYKKNVDFRAVSPMMIERFRKSKLEEGRTKSTCNRYLQLMKRMFNIAIEEGYAEDNPVRKVKLYSEKDNLQERVLTETEETKLMEASSETLKPILVVALNTGMRKAEILNLKWAQVDLKARRIRVEKTKSGKIRFIPVNDVLFNELSKLKNRSGKSPLVFFNPETGKPFLDMKTAFKGACKRAEISNLRFHDLRHTFASRLVEKGVDIETLKELLGHHSITITQRYIHSNDERKRAAVDLLSSREEGKICDVSVTQENQSKLIH